jgi:hypothetical protein
MDSHTSPKKSVVNLTKKAFANLTGYITSNVAPEHSQMIINVLKNGLMETMSFDPEATLAPEVSRRNVENRNRLLEKENTTRWERYEKKRYEKLKASHPDVPPSVLMMLSASERNSLKCA